MEEILKIGIITSSHGVHGEVKVYPTTDDPKRFKRLKEVLLGTLESTRPIQVLGVKLSKNMVILKLEGIDTPEAANTLRQKELFVPRAKAVPLKKDEYYIADLIGIAVYEDNGEMLGSISDVLTGTANDVYVVALADGKELLLPAIGSCILDVDVEGGKMLVHVLEGLR